jgi:predicted kinase
MPFEAMLPLLFMQTESCRPALILIGGGAASGKSRIAIEVVRCILNGVLLDKDCLFGEWVDAILSARGHAADRDCLIYWDYIRPLEYTSLVRLAFDHLRLGKVVVIDAPLRPELDNLAWLQQMEQSCNDLGASLAAIWIEVSPECARRRMQQRSEPRDKWKLENWNEFIRRQNYGPPRAAQLVLQNDDDVQKTFAVAKIIDFILNRQQL